MGANDIVVSKFGGSSVTSREDLLRIEDICGRERFNKAVVLSAPGKRGKDDEKVTDMLISLAKTVDDSLFSKVMERFSALGTSQIDKYSAILKQRLDGQYSSPAEREDAIKAFGEEACCRIFAEVTGGLYVDPRDRLVVTPNFGNAKILSESADNFKDLLGGRNFVFPGFFGYTKDGKIATLSRGGSDLSGAFLAFALGASLYNNFTDRDGIRSADPNIVEDASRIEEITFNEIRDLSYSGFSIFHQEAMDPVARSGIPVHVRNTRTYPSRGTIIVPDRVCNPERPIVGVAYQNGFCSINIARFGLNEERGVLRKIAEAFEHEGLSIEFIPSAIDDVTVVARESQLSGEKIGSLYKRIYSALGSTTSINMRNNLGCLVVAGKGIENDPRIAADIYLSLDDSAIPVRFMEMGAKRRCVVYGVDSRDGAKAVHLVCATYPYLRDSE